MHFPQANMLLKIIPSTRAENVTTRLQPVNDPILILCKLKISLYSDMLILSLRMTISCVKSHFPRDLPPTRLLCKKCYTQDCKQTWTPLIHFHIPGTKSQSPLKCFRRDHAFYRYGLVSEYPYQVLLNYPASVDQKRHN